MLSVTQALLSDVEATFGRMYLRYVAAQRGLFPELAAEAKATAAGVAVHAPLDVERRVLPHAARGADDLGELLDFLHARSPASGALRVHLDPRAPEAVREALQRRGASFRYAVNVLWRPLDASLATPDGASAPVDDAELDVASETYARGFEDDAPREAFLRFARTYAAMARTRFFLARNAEGVPMAAASLHLDGNIAILAGMAARPAFRGRRRQGRRIAGRLAHARREGARLAVMTAMPASRSQRNAERAGFRVAYPRVLLSCPAENR